MFFLSMRPSLSPVAFRFYGVLIPSNFRPGINGHVYFTLSSLSPVRLMLVGNQVWMNLMNARRLHFSDILVTRNSGASEPGPNSPSKVPLQKPRLFSLIQALSEFEEERLEPCRSGGDRRE